QQEREIPGKAPRGPTRRLRCAPRLRSARSEGSRRISSLCREECLERARLHPQGAALLAFRCRARFWEANTASSSPRIGGCGRGPTKPKGKARRFFQKARACSV